ncbi:hypothetical protein GQ53DRAFT_842763 [Thozetella sp. PMI_491]|nr:hypothetical protein GQ53DRAFT_842763 [Thozetella sp. PMI_491]
MKPATILVSALATLAAAAPAKEVSERSNFDLSLLNNLNSFNQVNLDYLLNINSLQLGLLGQLGLNQNFNILSFQSLFQNNAFDLNSLLQLQQLQVLLQFQQLGVLNGFDLSSLALSNVNLGLLGNIGSLDLTQFIQASAIPQIQVIAGQVGTGLPIPGIVTAEQEAAQDGAASLPAKN